jgi:hypothetical protein
MLGVVSGRRQGKTFLLDAVCRVAGGFYFGATEATDAESLRRLSAALTAYVRPASPYHFANWAEAVDALLALGSERPVPVVIDEFPYLARANPELPSIIQEALRPLREERTRSRARVLLCGSALSFMGRLLSGNAPLRGRAGLELVVRPLDHQLAAIVVFAIVNASCVVRCGGSVVGWETADGVVALRDARLASRTCVRDRRVAVEATVLWSLCDWGASGSDGLVANGRAYEVGDGIQTGHAIRQLCQPGHHPHARGRSERG